MVHRGGWGVTGEKYIVRAGLRWKVQIQTPSRSIARAIDNLEEAKACRDWLMSGTGVSCQTTVETYAHPDGKRWAAG